MKKIKPQQIRHAKIADLAANGMGTSAIADHLGIGVCQVNAIKLSNLPITRNLQEGKYMDKKMGGRTMQIRNEFRSL